MEKRVTRHEKRESINDYEAKEREMASEIEHVDDRVKNPRKWSSGSTL